MASMDEMTSRELQSWTSVAPGWRKHGGRLREASGPVSQALLDRAGIKPGDTVLDVACGTGEPAIPAAERVGPTGRVLATDFVDGMVAFAREKAAAASLRNIEFRVSDGEHPRDRFVTAGSTWRDIRAGR